MHGLANPMLKQSTPVASFKALPGAHVRCPVRCGSTVRQRQLRVQAGKRAAAAAATAAAAGSANAAQVATLLSPDATFNAATYVMVPLYFTIAFFPRSRVTKWILESPVLQVVIGAAYALLAWQAWQEGAFDIIRGVVTASWPLPDAASLAALFQHKTLAALAWLHLLLLDFLAAKYMLLDGLRHLVPTWHSVLLCFMVGPLGLLSHLTTRFIVHKQRKDKPAVAEGSMWS